MQPNNTSEVGIVEMNVDSNKLTKVLAGIIGILLVTLIVIINQWSTTEETLIRRNTILQETAKLYADVRDQNEFLRRTMKDYKYADFIRKVYEQRDKDFFETATIAYNRATENELSPFLVMSIIHRESAFNQFAQSYCAFGLMQINYEVWKLELELDIRRIFEKDYNIYNGLKIYKIYLKRAHNDPWRALFFYNNGENMSVEKANHRYPGVVMSSKFMLTSSVQ